MDLGAPLNESPRATVPNGAATSTHTTVPVERDTIPAHSARAADHPPVAPAATVGTDGPVNLPNGQAAVVPPTVPAAQVPMAAQANGDGRPAVDPSNVAHPAAQQVLEDRPDQTAVPSAFSTATSGSDPSKGTTAPATNAHQATAPTASIDPNKPSHESAPTAIPTNPATSPEQQKRAIQNEKPDVVRREVEKTKAEARELKGEDPQGTVVAGIEDDRLWALLRRFDVQITHVLHPATNLPPIEPDLRNSTLPKLPSHSDVLRSNLERVIAAVGPSAVRGTREAGRLMSWTPQERWRTGSFCAAYFICWLFGYTIAGVCSFFIAIVCFPGCRRWLFPPVAPAPFTPPSATDPTNQKGDESLLGNVDGATTYRSKAEQAEEQAFEATSILKAYTTRLLFDGKKSGKAAGNAGVGEKKGGTSSSSSSDEDDDLTKTKRDEASQGLESGAIVVGDKKVTPDKELSHKEKKKLAQNEAKKKRDEMVSKMTKLTETGLGDLADMIERMTNALSPPVAYPDSYARFKIAGAFIAPVMLLFTFVPPWIFGRAATFLFGVGFWGQPLIKMGMQKFVELVPNWQELLDMRNSILSRVPTDAQLTLHLLRVSEALNAPLPRPPPPPLAGTPKEAIKDTSIASAVAEDDGDLEEVEGEGGAKEAAVKVKHKTKEHIMGAFRAAGKKMAAFHGDVAVDGTKKQARLDAEQRENDGDLTTKEKIGTKVDKLLFRGHIKDEGTPQSYPCKLDGTSGHIILENRNDVLKEPRISFVPISGTKEHFVMPIDDIVEIKKSHVSMPRMALGWASGADVEGLGLTIRFKPVAQQIKDAMVHRSADREEGQTMHFTRVGRREQLFVRLVSMGVQRWEVL